MLKLDLFGFLNAFLVHETLFIHDKVIQGTPTIDSIRLFELLGIRQSVKEKEELWIVFRVVDSACQLLHLLFDLAHLLLLIQSRTSV